MIAALILAAALALPDSVCVTEHGTRYHKPNARHCAGVLVLRADADSAGYLACKPCFAPRSKRGLRPFDRLKGGKP